MIAYRAQRLRRHSTALLFVRHAMHSPPHRRELQIRDGILATFKGPARSDLMLPGPDPARN